MEPLDRVAFYDSPDFRAFRAGFLAEVLIERGEVGQAQALFALPIAANQGYRYHLLDGAGGCDSRPASPSRRSPIFSRLGASRQWRELRIPPSFRGARRRRSRCASSAGGRGTSARARRTRALSQRGARPARWVSLRALGLVEGGQAGELLLREAVEVLADSPARLEHARALVDLGGLLRRDNSRSQARKVLRAGIEHAHRAAPPP